MYRNRLLTLLILLLSGMLAYAQEPESQDTVWRINGKTGFLFNQVALTNWSGGGENSLAMQATFDIDLKYKQEKWKWDNIIRLGYGLSKQGEETFNKTHDQLFVNTNLGYDLGGPWYLTFNANFRTQFADGYKLPNDSVKVSAFMAPGYLVTAIGIEYKPNEHLMISVNPISNKTIFVMDDVLAAQGAYGVDSLANIKELFGAFISLAYKKEIVKNVTLGTLYMMFGDYKNLASWDINWDMILDFKINDFLEANLTMGLIYDEDIAISVDNTGDGVKESFGPRVQFRQALGIGLVARF